MLTVLSKKCTGCRVCEIICSLEHAGVINPKRARIKVYTRWPDDFTISVCQQCKTPACVEACPTGALRKENWIILNEELCTSCMLCVKVCPYGAVRIDRMSSLPLFCDTCQGKYTCTEWCNSRALQVEE